jgi:hypothetical protein
VTRAPLALAATVLALTLPACTSVLGLDPPTLAQCLDGGCADAPARDAPIDSTADVLDATGVDSEAGADSDAAADSRANETSCANDAAPDAIPAGVQCGGGCFGVTYCTSPTPVCCQGTNDAGVTTYACTASESTCSGYPIVCANDDDCGGSDICCHFTTKMTCDTTSACPSNDLVCRPDMPIDCPTGKACNIPAVNAGVTSPYYLCQP